MEKYCTSCGRVFDDLNYKLCPFCGGKLDIRYGRQPIPRKLRHEVFKRDGYRCRECGASKDETSLEIDHMIQFNTYEWGSKGFGGENTYFFRKLK